MFTSQRYRSWQKCRLTTKAVAVAEILLPIRERDLFSALQMFATTKRPTGSPALAAALLLRREKERENILSPVNH